NQCSTSRKLTGAARPTSTTVCRLLRLFLASSRLRGGKDRRGHSDHVHLRQDQRREYLLEQSFDRKRLLLRKRAGHRRLGGEGGGSSGSVRRLHRQGRCGF